MTEPSSEFRAAFDAGAAWATATTERVGRDEAVRQAWDARATTPGDDRGRELADAQVDMVARAMGSAARDPSSPDYRADARDLLNRLRALAAPAETEAGDITAVRTELARVREQRDRALAFADAQVRELERTTTAGGAMDLARRRTEVDRLRRLAATPPSLEGEAERRTAYEARWRIIHGALCKVGRAWGKNRFINEGTVACGVLSDLDALHPPAPGEGQGATEGELGRALRGRMDELGLPDYADVAGFERHVRNGEGARVGCYVAEWLGGTPPPPVDAPAGPQAEGGTS